MSMKKMFHEGNQIHNFMSSSGSDFLTSYCSGSTSQKVTVPTVPVPVHTIEKVTVPVPAPYLDHKKQILKKNFEFFFTFYSISCFTRKKFINFNKFMVKCERKKFLMKEIKYIILCVVPVPEP
jgi:hypothetical protein